jgi:hypothetical protein
VAAGVEHARVVVATANEPVEEVDVAVMAAPVDAETNAAHSQTTLTSPTLTETSLLMSGSDSARCDHMYYNCEKAAAVAAVGETEIKMTTTQTASRAV